jgi:hypothetical protein
MELNEDVINRYFNNNSSPNRKPESNLISAEVSLPFPGTGNAGNGEKVGKVTSDLKIEIFWKRSSRRKIEKKWRQTTFGALTFSITTHNLMTRHLMRLIETFSITTLGITTLGITTHNLMTNIPMDLIETFRIITIGKKTHNLLNLTGT